MASSFTDENENFMRLVLLMNEKGTEAFQECLLHFSTLRYGVGNFDDVLLKARVILKTLRGRPITAQQWKILHPGAGIPVLTSQLDITLCFVLLRNICGLNPPLTSWDKPPATGDNSVEGGLAQLKFIRNLLSHSQKPKLSDADFQIFFDKTKDAILNIKQKLPGWSVTSVDILAYKTHPISPALEADLQDIVKEWAQQESDLKTEITEITKGITTLGAGQTDIIDKLGTIEKGMENRISEKLDTALTQLPELVLQELMKTIMKSGAHVTLPSRMEIQENVEASDISGTSDEEKERNFKLFTDEIERSGEVMDKVEELVTWAGEAKFAKRVQELLDKCVLTTLVHSSFVTAPGSPIHLVMELHAKCLRNMKSTLYPVLIPSFISCDQEFSEFNHNLGYVSWVHLEGKGGRVFRFTDITLLHLSIILNKNKQPCSVFLGGDCECDLDIMKKIIRLLRGHNNVKYKVIIFGKEHHSYRYEKGEWEEIFEELRGIKELLVLGLDGCEIPCTVLETLGEILNTNASTLYALDIGNNPDIQGNFHLIIKQVKTQDPFVLSLLRLHNCLGPSDKASASIFLSMVKGSLRYLFFLECKCDIGEVVLTLEHIRVLLFGFDHYNSLWKRLMAIFNVDPQNTYNQDINVKKILPHIHCLKHLFSFVAIGCGIDDTLIKSFQIERTSIRAFGCLDRDLSPEVRSEIEQRFKEANIVLFPVWKFLRWTNIVKR